MSTIVTRNVKDLPQHGRQYIEEILGNALQDESGRIRRVAMEASKRLGTRAEPLVPVILVLLDRDADRPVALATLKEIPVRSVKPLVNALNHRDAAVRVFRCRGMRIS